MHADVYRARALALLAIARSIGGGGGVKCLVKNFEEGQLQTSTCMWNSFITKAS